MDNDLFKGKLFYLDNSEINGLGEENVEIYNGEWFTLTYLELLELKSM